MTRSFFPLAIVFASSLAFAQAPATPIDVTALRLPRAAQTLVEAGVPDGEIQNALDSAQSAGLSSAQGHELFAAAAADAKANGAVPGFSAYIKDGLGKGERGKALVDAMRTHLVAMAPPEAPVATGTTRTGSRTSERNNDIAPYRTPVTRATTEPTRTTTSSSSSNNGGNRGSTSSSGDGKGKGGGKKKDDEKKGSGGGGGGGTNRLHDLDGGGL